MRILSLQRLFHSLLICSLVGVGLLVVGCDSGGSNGGGGDGNLSGSVTARLAESSSSGSQAKADVNGEFVAVFTFSTDSGNCTALAREAANGSTPIEEELEPVGTCEGDDFDEVEVSFVSSSGAISSDLSLNVLSNGNTVASTSSATAAGNLSVTASDATDDGDGSEGDSGDDGSDGDNGGGGSVPSALTGNWKLTETTQENVDLSEADLFYSITSDQINITFKGNSFCETDMETITNVDGNTITTDDNDGDEPSNATFEITNGGNTLTVEGLNGGTLKATRVDSIPDCS